MRTARAGWEALQTLGKGRCQVLFEMKSGKAVFRSQPRVDYWAPPGTLLVWLASNIDMSGRRLCRVIYPSAIGLVILAVMFSASSYVAALWDARRTEVAQHEVWSAYLNSELASQGVTPVENPARRGFIVVQDHTERAYRPLLLSLCWPYGVMTKQRPYSRLPTLDAVTYVRYLLGALRSHPVRRRLALAVPYRLADSDALATYGRDWKRWDALFPHAEGYFVLSNVGFNTDGTQALLHAEHICGLCGHGGYVLMRKESGRWTVAAEASSWVS